MEQNKKLTQEEIDKQLRDREQERERENILMQADEIKEETFDFTVDGQIVVKNEIAEMFLDQIDDPEEKYHLYYNVVTRLLKKHLPKGEQNKVARNLVYEEKNTFLTRGHRKDDRGIRGADSRMAYSPDMADLINIITEWISTKGGMFQLYTKIRDLNISKGYGKPKE